MKTQFISGNDVQLLKNSAEYFPALESAINQAQTSIYLQTFIFADDVIGNKIAHALKHAALRGVTVNLLLDGFGSKDLSKKFVRDLEQAGIRLMFYRPKISPWTFKKSRLRRLHRKVSVFDSTLAFVGGINIVDDYPENSSQTQPPRVDYAVQIQGALLPEIASSCEKLWKRMAWKRLEWRSQATNIHAPARASDLAINSEIKAAFVLRDNVLHRRDIERAYLTAIHLAQSEIIIANAYFVPGRHFRKALLNAVKRGVKVTLLLQGRKEHFLMFATHVFYSDFLKRGIEIFEYHKSFMHSKVAVIDGHWATVGSSNIDPFSLLLAREANIIVLDTAFAETLRADIIQCKIDGATKLEVSSWQHGNILKRALAWVVYGVVRLFLGVIGARGDV